MDRHCAATAPDRLRVADITYIPTAAGFLAVVLDVWVPRGGWATARHLRTALVLQALDLALGLRSHQQVIHHSDQGLSVHIDCFRTALSGGRGAPLNGLGR